MATHSSILAWEIPWAEEPGGLQSMGLPKSMTRGLNNNNVSVCLSIYLSITIARKLSKDSECCDRALLTQHFQPVLLVGFEGDVNVHEPNFPVWMPLCVSP